MMVVLLLALTRGVGNAGVENGLEFLIISVGARASGMGGAFVAVADDASATYWNPAGLSRVRPQVMFEHNAYIVDMRQEYLAGLTDFRDWTFAASLNVLDLGTIEKRDDSGLLLGEFRPFDVALGMSAAYPLGALSLGVTAKGIMHDIDTETAMGILFDVGALWESPSPLDGLSIGLTARNLGPSLTFVEESFNAPLGIRGGFAYRLDIPGAKSSLVVSADYERLRGGYEILSYGGEWRFTDYLSGRLGGITAEENTQNFTAGFGAHYLDLTVDYAFVPFKSDLGSSHRIGVTYTFRR